MAFGPRFKSLTTDIRGLHPDHQRKVNRLNIRTASRMQKRVEKVTNKFTSRPKPTFKVVTGMGEPPSEGGGATGRALAQGKSRALWAAAITSNDKRFYYLEVGARRFRGVSPNWQSLTRPGAGLRTFPRRGWATYISRTQISYIKPRYFAAAAADAEAPRYINEARKLFGKQSVNRFFGKVHVR